MRIFFSVILLLSILLLSCGQGKKEPAGLLPEKKLRAVVWDMMRADQFLTDFVFSRDTSINKLEESLQVYNRIFAIHKVTKEEFRESFDYYRKQPDLLKALLDSVSNMNIAPVVSPVPDTTKKSPVLPPVTQPDTGKTKRIKPFRGN